MECCGVTCVLLSFKCKTWSHLPRTDEKKYHPRLENWWGSGARHSGKGPGLGFRTPGDAHELCDLGDFALSGFLSVSGRVRLGLSSFCLSLELSAKPLPTADEPLLTSEWVGAVTWGGSASSWMWAPKGEQSPWGCRSIARQPLCSVNTVWVHWAPPLPSTWAAGVQRKPHLNQSAAGSPVFSPDPRQPVLGGSTLLLGLCPLPPFWIRTIARAHSLSTYPILPLEFYPFDFFYGSFFFSF